MLVKQQSVLTQATTCTSAFILSQMRMRQNKCRRKIPMQKRKFIVNYFLTHNIFALHWVIHVGKHCVEFFNNNILFIIVGFLLSPLLYSDRIFRSHFCIKFKHPKQLCWTTKTNETDKLINDMAKRWLCFYSLDIQSAPISHTFSKTIALTVCSCSS